MPKISATQRLLNLLRRAVQEHAHLGADAPVGQVLAAIVGCAKDDLPAQQDAYVHLLELCDKAGDEITAYYWDADISKDDASHLLKQAKQPLEVIRSNLLANSIHSKGRVVAQFELAPLEVLALTVTRQSAEQILQKEDIADAREALTHALQVITDSSLEPRFKGAFSLLISKALTALNQYDIFGPDAVAEAVAILMAQSVPVTRQASPNAATGLSKALGIAGSVFTIVYRGIQIYKGLSHPAPDDITRFLPPGDTIP